MVKKTPEYYMSSYIYVISKCEQKNHSQIHVRNFKQNTTTAMYM